MPVARGTTTIRIREADKDRLAALQRRWQRRRGEEVTQQDLISKALSYAERHIDPFLEEEGWRPWKAEEIDALFDALVSDWGVETSSDQIDDIVYGDP